MNLKPNIAMIDDEYDLIDTYKELLGAKYNVTEFYDAESYLKYLEKFETNPFEVVISDYSLGAGANGLDMLEKANSLNKHAAFILMSGYLDKESTLRAHNMGAHRILPKPIRIETLETEIQNLMGSFISSPNPDDFFSGNNRGWMGTNIYVELSIDILYRV